MNKEDIPAIKTADKWTEKEIAKRTEFLVSRFLAKVFPIDNQNDIYKY